MSTQCIFSQEELRKKTISFFSKNVDVIEIYKMNIEEHMKVLIQNYLAENNLPGNSISVLSRTKNLKSVLKKLECKGWPQFNRLPEVIEDLIGTRIICWYLDDCYGIEKCVKQSPFFNIDKTENYIEKPKCSGYRAIHLTSILEKAAIKSKTRLLLQPFKFEIQIRTKLQDAWGDLSHDFYYKSKTREYVNKKYESFLAERARRLFKEDKEFNKFKLIWQTVNDKCI